MRLDHLLSRETSKDLFGDWRSKTQIVSTVLRRWMKEALPITFQLSRTILGLVAQLVRALC